MKHKNIIVTGSTGRLGRVVAQRFIDSGHHVVGFDRKDEPAISWPILKIDVTSEESVEEAFARHQAQFGAPDVVIHTVGMWNMSNLTSTSLSEWNLLLDLNLTSTFLVFRGAIRLMKSQGCLIAFSSRQGAASGQAEQAGYSASKGGLVRLVVSIAAEYASSTLQAHVIAPSTILFEDEQLRGIHATEIASMCVSLSETDKKTNGGPVHLAFGNG